MMHQASVPLILQQFLVEKNIPVIILTPYTLDLDPSDFWLFLALKMALKGTRFATIEDMNSNATAEFRKMPKEAFRQFFQRRNKFARGGSTLNVIR
jgi:hypothetical protein